VGVPPWDKFLLKTRLLWLPFDYKIFYGTVFLIVSPLSPSLFHVVKEIFFNKSKQPRAFDNCSDGGFY